MPIPIEKDLTKIIKLQEKLKKVDDLIFIIIGIFCFLILVQPAISELSVNNSGIINIFRYDPTAYNDLQENILGTAVIISFIALFILFNLHFRIRNRLGQTGLDSLAERLRNFFNLPPQGKK
ncbi:MAG: hypothetical protein WC460_02965 [Patescibacteria group bacterium]